MPRLVLKCIISLKDEYISLRWHIIIVKFVCDELSSFLDWIY